MRRRSAHAHLVLVATLREQQDVTAKLDAAIAAKVKELGYG
jgi:hypothetical protein